MKTSAITTSNTAAYALVVLNAPSQQIYDVVGIIGAHLRFCWLHGGGVNYVCMYVWSSHIAEYGPTG